MSEEITTKEIRGITTKVLLWFFGGVTSIIVTFVWGYASITYQLKSMNDKGGDANTNININSAKIERIKQDMQLFDIRLTRVEENIKDKVFLKDAP